MSFLDAILNYVIRSDAGGRRMGDCGQRDNPAYLRALFADEFAAHDRSAVRMVVRNRMAKATSGRTE